MCRSEYIWFSTVNNKLFVLHELTFLFNLFGTPRQSCFKGGSWVNNDVSPMAMRRRISKKYYTLEDSNVIEKNILLNKTYYLCVNYTHKLENVGKFAYSKQMVHLFEKIISLNFNDINLHVYFVSTYIIWYNVSSYTFGVNRLCSPYTDCVIFIKVTWVYIGILWIQ